MQLIDAIKPAYNQTMAIKAHGNLHCKVAGKQLIQLSCAW